MDISSIASINYGDYMEQVAAETPLSWDGEEDFKTVLDSAMQLLTETDDLQNAAQAEKISFALGEADNPHDMQIAAAKALEALQYTTAIRDRLVDAYKEIMNMQI